MNIFSKAIAALHHNGVNHCIGHSQRKKSRADQTLHRSSPRYAKKRDFFFPALTTKHTILLQQQEGIMNQKKFSKAVAALHHDGVNRCTKC